MGKKNATDISPNRPPKKVVKPAKAVSVRKKNSSPPTHTGFTPPPLFFPVELKNCQFSDACPQLTARKMTSASNERSHKKDLPHLRHQNI
jgi:hypothetical protein